MNNRDRALDTAMRIEGELFNRCGLAGAWDSIDDEDKDGIRDAMEGIIQRALDAAAAEAARLEREACLELVRWSPHINQAVALIRARGEVKP